MMNRVKLVNAKCETEQAAGMVTTIVELRGPAPEFRLDPVEPSSGVVDLRSASRGLLFLIEHWVAGSKAKTELTVNDVFYGVIRLHEILDGVVQSVVDAGLPPEFEREILAIIVPLQLDASTRAKWLWDRQEVIDPNHDLSSQILTNLHDRIEVATPQLRKVAHLLLAEAEIRNRRTVAKQKPFPPIETVSPPTELPSAKVADGAPETVTLAMWQEACALHKQLRSWKEATRAYNARHETGYSQSTISGWGRYLRRRSRKKAA